MWPNVGARQSRSFAKITCGLRASAQSDLFIIGPDAPGQHRFPRYRRLESRVFGLFGIGLVGAGSRFAQTPSRRVVVFLADPLLSTRLLRHLSSCPLSSSDRAGADDPDRVCDFTSREEGNRLKEIPS